MHDLSPHRREAGTMGKHAGTEFLHGEGGWM